MTHVGRGIDWIATALVLWISYLSIPQILDLDGYFTRARLGDDAPIRLRFSDFAEKVSRGPVPIVSRYRHLLALLAIGAPLGALASLRLSGWRGDLARGVCMVIALVVFFYTDIAIHFL